MPAKNPVLDFSFRPRLQLVRQEELAESGLACLVIVANFYGNKVDLTSARHQHGVSLRGATLPHIVETSSKFGLGARIVNCEASQLASLRLPAILQWDSVAYVVLKEVRGNRVVVLDPSRGTTVFRLEEAGRHFSGIAIELRPTMAFTSSEKAPSLKFHQLIRFDGETRKALLLGLALSFVIQAFVLLGPYYLQLVLDEAIPRYDADLLLTIALGFTLLKLFEIGATILRGLTFQFITFVMAFDMKANVFRHLLQLPLHWFHRRSLGEVQQRYQSLRPIYEFATRGAIVVIVDGILSIGIAFAIIIYQPAVFGIVMLGISVYATVRLLLLKVSKGFSIDMMAADARESGQFLETLRGIQAVKMAAAEPSREAMLRDRMAQTIETGVRFGWTTIGFGAISQAIFGFSTIAAIYYSAQGAMAGTISVGVITAVIAYKTQFEQRAIALIEQYAAWRMLEANLERVADITSQQPEQSADARQRKGFSGGVTFSGVCFRYSPSDPEVLTSINFSIEPGEFVAITGLSGAGKSTLLKILSTLYSATSGHVLFDGIDVRSWEFRDLRSQIGVVMQDDTLLHGSLLENITMFEETPDFSRVEEVSKIACIHDEIHRTPMGYRSLVGDMGSALSGGQVQRVLLARALYRRPALLVMDEGTAHLDEATEARINASLSKLRITRVIASHRPATVALADRVVCVDRGMVSVLRPATQTGGPEEPSNTASTKTDEQ